MKSRTRAVRGAQERKLGGKAAISNAETSALGGLFSATPNKKRPPDRAARIVSGKDVFRLSKPQSAACENGNPRS